jgi:hypothetical protein
MISTRRHILQLARCGEVLDQIVETALPPKRAGDDVRRQRAVSVSVSLRAGLHRERQGGRHVEWPPRESARNAAVRAGAITDPAAVRGRGRLEGHPRSEPSRPARNSPSRHRPLALGLEFGEGYSPVPCHNFESASVDSGDSCPA